MGYPGRKPGLRKAWSVSHQDGRDGQLLLPHQAEKQKPGNQKDIEENLEHNYFFVTF